MVVISSLAGRLDAPVLPKGLTRMGGFGGVSGLLSFLQMEKIDIVIDATHPFAANITANAAAACATLALPLIGLVRPPWTQKQNDHWYVVPDMESAASHVERFGGRVLLAIGRQQIGAFALCKKATLVIRSIDPPAMPLPANAELILDRGPYEVDSEVRLLDAHAIDYIVSKNSGGAATYAKIEAARVLGLPVVMIDRPRRADQVTLDSVESVLASLHELLSSLSSKEEAAG